VEASPERAELGDREHTGAFAVSAARLTSWVPWLCVAGSRRVCLYRRAVAQSSVMLANEKRTDICGHTVARHQPALDSRQPTGSRFRAQPSRGTSGLRAYRNVDRAIITSRQAAEIAEADVSGAEQEHAAVPDQPPSGDGPFHRPAHPVPRLINEMKDWRPLRAASVKTTDAGGGPLGSGPR
jgi:hypothetical protein